MKKLFAIAMLIASTMVMVSCGKDDGGTVQSNITIKGVDATATATVGTKYSVEVSLTSTAGLLNAKYTDGKTTKTVTFENNPTSAKFKLEYTPTAKGTVTIGITVTDKNNGTKTTNVVLTVGNEFVIKSAADGLASVQGYDASAKKLTLNSDVTYILDGFVFVNEGQTLSIPAGTVIKGKPGQGEGASALIVAKGGKIDAQGTAAKPIIFTGVADNLSKTSPSVPVDAKALWGGLIILGNGPSNLGGNGTATKNVEGIKTTEKRGTYGGGSKADDNSGTLKYVSVRHGGSIIGENNEINGITFGTVGSGTTVDHVEVWSNLDDGIEWFGGNVNVTNFVIALCGDDGPDMDEGFSGTLQFGVVLHTASTLQSDDPRGAELDGDASSDEGQLTNYANPTIANVSFLYVQDNKLSNINAAARVRDNMAVNVINNVFYGHGADFEIEFRGDKGSGTGSSYHRYLESDATIQGNLFYIGSYNKNDIKDFNPFTTDATVFGQKNEKSPTKGEVITNLTAKFNAGVGNIYNNVGGIDLSAGDFSCNVTTGLFNESGISTFTRSGVTAKLKDVNYRGGVDPNGTAFFKGWSKLDGFSLKDPAVKAR